MSTFARVLRKHDTIWFTYATAILILAVGTVLASISDSGFPSSLRFYLVVAMFGLLTALVLGFAAAYEIAEAHDHDRVQPDDEIVFAGHFHMERMDEDHIWFRIGDASFDLHAVKHRGKVKLTWKPQVNWENVAAVLGWPFLSSQR